MTAHLFTRPAGSRAELLGLGLLLVAIPVAALPHVWEQPPWVMLVLLAAWLWRAAIHAANARLPAVWVLVLLVAGGGGATLAQFGTVFGQEAGTALLLVMTALKLLEIRSQRDIVVTLFLTYFLVVTTYFFNQSFLIAAYSLVSAWLITAALIQVHAGRSFPLRRLARSSALMIVHAVPIMLILFVVFPRIPGPIWGTQEPDRPGQTGLSERLEPGDITQLLENQNTALRVRFDGPAPPLNRQYWRALVLTDFDGRAWRVDWNRPEIEAFSGGPVDVSYTVMLEPTRSRYLPLLDFPAEAPDEARLLDNLQAIPRQRVDNRLHYSASARLEPPAGGLLSPADRARYLALPEGAAPRARTLAGVWRGAHGDDDTAVVGEALALFAADPFRYTLRPPLLQGDRTDAFLFETRAGYCEHYASGLAVLMRAAGIPARVITGYQGGQWMDTGNYLRLRYADAHAWNEIWLEGRGWVRVDPTAAIAPGRIETGLGGLFADDADTPDFLRRSGLSWTARWRLRASDWHDLLTFRWEHLVLAFDPERQRELFARFGLDPTDWRSVLLALAVSMGGIGAAAGLFAWLRRPRTRLDPQQRALHRLSRRLGRIGLARQPQETAARYTARVAASRPDLAPMLADFEHAYTQLRYAVLEPAETQRLQRELRRSLRDARV
jgi:protein-glutamine gamma-glutamyltransferase